MHPRGHPTLVLFHWNSSDSGGNGSTAREDNNERISEVRSAGSGREVWRDTVSDLLQSNSCPGAQFDHTVERLEKVRAALNTLIYPHFSDNLPTCLHSMFIRTLLSLIQYRPGVSTKLSNTCLFPLKPFAKHPKLSSRCLWDDWFEDRDTRGSNTGADAPSPSEPVYSY